MKKKSDIFLQNTLSGEKEKFVPLKEGEVSMYACGLTVYDYGHIGNFRSFILADLLRRTFEYNKYKVNEVINITDIDDKTIKRSRKEGVSLKELTEKYEKAFFSNIKAFNILLPESTPRATESIPEMIILISKMLESGVAYKSSDGVYFDITKSPGYGTLAHLNLDNKTQERVANDEYDKESPRDFALWKFYTEDDGDVSYEAAFGKGRPGWHIECSAMVIKSLGETIDIHTGGTDLIFPHHTNEIAQSEAVTGKKFVNYWLHGGFITVDGKKMSKSLGNIFTLKDLKKKKIDPLAYRYFVLGARYSTLLNFTWEALEGAQISLNRLRTKVSELGEKIVDSLNDQKTIIKDYKKRFQVSINDDLDTPVALSLVWEVLKNEDLNDKDKKKLIMSFDKVLGLKVTKKIKINIPENVQMLIKERDTARAEKDFAKSDEIRAQIESLGFEVKDTPEGTVVEQI